MKLFIVLAFCVFTNSTVLGVTLDGTWKEDVIKTIQWNSKHIKTGNGYLEKLRAVLGHLYVSYENGTSCLYIEPYTLKYKDNISTFDLFLQKWKYEVLALNEYGFIIRTTFEDIEYIEMIVFENETSIYSYRLTSDEDSNPGFRLYMKKVSNKKIMSDCGA